MTRRVPEPAGLRCRWPAMVAWGLAGFYVLAFAVALWLDVRAYLLHDPPNDIGLFDALMQRGFFGVPFVLFPVVGAAIVSRRSRNTVGWVMVAAGTALATSALAVSGALVLIGSSPTDPPALALVAKWIEGPGLALAIVLALVFVPLLFPDGRLPSRRWRPVVWLAAVHVVVASIDSSLSPRLTDEISAFSDDGSSAFEVYDIPNPLGAAWMEPVISVASTVRLSLMVGLVLLAAVAVVVRFRSSAGVERQQMKWFVFATAAVAVLFSFATAMGVGEAGASLWMWVGVVFGSFVGYPVAIGVAVLRYRLYEIDRIVSRTVSYGLVVAILGGVYVAAVVGLGAAATALTGAEDSDLVVALSTLLAAGLFQPVRTRVQTAVDRRFNRTGYEARQAVEAFVRDVRDEVDLDRIRWRATETAAVTAQPSHVSLWVADDERMGP